MGLAEDEQRQPDGELNGEGQAVGEAKAPQGRILQRHHQGRPLPSREWVPRSRQSCLVPALGGVSGTNSSRLCGGATRGTFATQNDAAYDESSVGQVGPNQQTCFDIYSAWPCSP